MIINNNNNNGSCGHGCSCHNHADTAGNRPGREATSLLPPELTDCFKRYDRRSMIILSRFLGWTGAHYFHFNKPLFGVLHLLASLAGFFGFMLSCFLFVVTDCSYLVLLLPLGLLPLLVISAVAGLVCSIYWSLQTDEDFRKAYPDCHK